MPNYIHILKFTSFEMKGLLISFFIIILMNQGFGQMLITITLPVEDSGRIEILNLITFDSTKTLTAETFNGQDILIRIPSRKVLLKNNPVLKYIIYGREKTYEATFAGEKGSIKINLEHKLSIYAVKSKFYKLTQEINNFTGDTASRILIIEEIARLYEKYPTSAYVQFIIYNAVINNLISGEELNENFNLNSNKSYWIGKVKEYLIVRFNSMSEYFDRLAKYNKDHEFVLVKFWASWCRP